MENAELIINNHIIDHQSRESILELIIEAWDKYLQLTNSSEATSPIKTVAFRFSSTKLGLKSLPRNKTRYIIQGLSR